MADIFTPIKEGQKLLAQSTLELDNGEKVVSETIDMGNGNYVIGQFHFEKNSKEITKMQWCGYCGGRFIGCVSCPDFTLDCRNHTIYC